ncbi:MULTISPECIES: murein hydrolase activator EnvC family protein [unclassified Plantibacter]|uniref:murein hydrolase activator EnvC family protein n=1 Tax=unclassified Plantibacter TaxID=2624265 RepID=UPI003D351F9F
MLFHQRSTIVLSCSLVLLVGLAVIRTPGVAAVAHESVERPQSRWSWPVADPHPVTRPFEAPPTPYSAGHRGIDIGAAEGTPALAVDDGVVSFAGVVVDRPIVSVRHADGLVSSIEPVTAAVGVGDVVARGAPIGAVSTGGHCAAGCVHLGARRDRSYLNPMLFLGEVPAAVLLPLTGASVESSSARDRSDRARRVVLRRGGARSDSCP